MFKRGVLSVVFFLLFCSAAILTRCPEAAARDIVLLVDNSGSMRTTHDVRRRIPDSIIKFVDLIKQKHPEDRIALIRFQSDAVQIIPLLSPSEVKDPAKGNLNNALEEGLKYNGEWTAFLPAFKQALKSLEGGRERYVVLISDGRPDQSRDKNENERLTSLDIAQTRNYLFGTFRKTGTVLYCIPFSERANRSHLENFVRDAGNGSRISETVVRGEDVSDTLKRLFVYDCRDFPPGHDITFNIGVVTRTDNEIFTNIFKMVERDLPRNYPNVRFRNVNVERRMVGDLPWAWEAPDDSRKLAELMRKERVNGLMLLYSPGTREFRFRLLDCMGRGEPHSCITGKQIGQVEDLCGQFMDVYPDLEIQMIKRMVPPDIVNQTYLVRAESLGGDHYPVKDINCRLHIYENGTDVTDELAGDCEIDIRRTSQTDKDGFVTFPIPRTAEHKIVVYPEDDKTCASGPPLAEKQVDKGWNRSEKPVTINIPNDEINFPEVKRVLAYAKQRMSDQSIANVSSGNVKADIVFEEKGGEGSGHRYKMSLESENGKIPQGHLMRGKTYKVRAEMGEFLLAGVETKIFINDETTEKYIRTYEGERKGGGDNYSIPFYLNFAAILHQKVLADPVSQNQIREVFNQAKGFLEDGREHPNREHPFKLSTGNEIFDMAAALSRRLESREERIELWGELLLTKFSCRPGKNEKDNKKQWYACAEIVTALIGDRPEDISHFRNYLAIAEGFNQDLAHEPEMGKMKTGIDELIRKVFDNQEREAR